MRAVPIEYIKPKAILGDTLYSIEGVMLAKKGSLLSEKLLEKIKQNQIFTIYIDDEHSDVEISRLLHPNMVNKAMLLIKDIFQAAGFRDSNGELKSKSILEFNSPLSALVDDMIDEIFTVKDNPLEYINIKSVENYLYMSSLNCGILSAIVAMDLGYTREMIKNIFMAGIYHDIGMALIPKEVFSKKDSLTVEEKMMIINHPKIGHEFLKDKNFLPSYVKQATYQHHERLNGTGYPNRTAGEEVSIISQIVGITDVFDAMISDRPYSRATAPNEAIEYLMACAGTAFDSELISIFTKKINPYPPGSLVELTTGQVAVVESVPSGFPLRPKISLITGTSGNYRYEIRDLLEENTLVIKKMIYTLDE